MGVLIHRASADDVGRFAAIADGVFDETVCPDRLAAYLGAPGHLLILALDANTVVGQCAGVVHHHPDKVSELYVDEVGTATSHLRQGIASAMLAEVFAWGRELGCSEAWLGTEIDNAAANGLYRRLGGEEDTITCFEFKL